MHVQPASQMSIVNERLREAFIRDRYNEWPCRIVQREGGCPRHSAWHVRDAIMENAVDGECRVRVCGRMLGFSTAALVDGNVDDHRTGFHQLDGSCGYEPWRGATRHQRRRDNGVSGRAEAPGRLWLSHKRSVVPLKSLCQFIQ